MLRIHVDDSLSTATHIAPNRLPVEMIISGTEILYVDSLVIGRVTSTLLDNLQEGMSVAEFVQFGRREIEDVAAGHNSTEGTP